MFGSGFMWVNHGWALVYSRIPAGIVEEKFKNAMGKHDGKVLQRPCTGSPKAIDDLKMISS